MQAGWRQNYFLAFNKAGNYEPKYVTPASGYLKTALQGVFPPRSAWNGCVSLK
jgi:hypothetical protein